MQLNGLSCVGTGVISQDPQLNYIGQNGDRAVVNGSVAFNRSYQVNKEWKKETTFINLALYGDQAKRFADLCPKGTPVVLSGYIKADQWEDKTTGKKVTRHVLVVQTFQVLAKTGNGNGGQAKGQAQAQAKPQQQAQAGNDGPPVNAAQENDIPVDVDIPF